MRHVLIERAVARWLRTEIAGNPTFERSGSEMGYDWQAPPPDRMAAAAEYGREREAAEIPVLEGSGFGAIPESGSFLRLLAERPVEATGGTAGGGPRETMDGITLRIGVVSDGRRGPAMADLALAREIWVEGTFGAWRSERLRERHDRMLSQLNRELENVTDQMDAGLRVLSMSDLGWEVTSAVDGASWSRLADLYVAVEVDVVA